MALERTSWARCLSAAVVGFAALLAGCVDGVDLNGKVFDVMGISPAAQDARRSEPQMADRAPLVMPPDANRLPAPGSGQSVPIQMAWPDDPDARKQREAQERQRLHEAYCRGEVQWKEKAFDPQSAGAPRSPYGPCPTVFSGVSVNKE